MVDLDAEDLERMLGLDETLFVEHKKGMNEESTHNLVKAIASFANTQGGWLLIGVQDGRPVGGLERWEKPDGPSLVDAIRDRLRGELDPLPAFEAAVIPYPGHSIGVVRVYESTDTPHVSISTGSVYVREVAGTSDAAVPGKPGAGRRGQRIYEATQIRSREQLLALAERGRRATERVRQLVDPALPLPMLREKLPLTFERTGDGSLQPIHTGEAAIVARVVPFTRVPRFQGWATSADAAAAVLSAAELLSLRRGLSPSWAEPDPSGVSAAVSVKPGALHRDPAGVPLDVLARVVLDGAGVSAAALSLEDVAEERRGLIRLEALAQNFIVPVVMAATQVLAAGEFPGHAWCQIDLIAIGRSLTLEESAQGAGRAWVPTGGNLSLPAGSEEVGVLCQRAANAYGRSAGIAAWD